MFVTVYPTTAQYRADLEAIYQQPVSQIFLVLCGFMAIGLIVRGISS